MYIYSYIVSVSVKQLYKSKVNTVCLLINKHDNQYIECNSKWNNNFMEIEIEESNIRKIEIYWDRHNLHIDIVQRRETLSNQRHFH